MIHKWEEYIKEVKEEGLDFASDVDDNRYEEFKEEIKSMIKSTIEQNGGEFNTFVDSFNKSPEDYQIEGLINDSDIYDFYLKFRNDIDEVLNDVKYFDEIPSENNTFGLYEYTINGTIRAVIEIVKSL